MRWSSGSAAAARCRSGRWRIPSGGAVHLIAVVASPDGSHVVRADVEASGAADAAEAAARALLDGGAAGDPRRARTGGVSEVPGTLEGRTVMVTRPRAQAGALAERLRARGARVIVAPAIRLVPAPAKAIDRAVERAVAGEFAWVVVTSRAGAETLLARLATGGRGPKDVRAHVAAVGDGTASVLPAGGLRPALVPPSFTTESLGRAMPKGTGTVLLARADIAPEGLERVLERKGWTVERVDAYRTRFPGRCRWPPAGHWRPGPSTRWSSRVLHGAGLPESGGRGAPPPGDGRGRHGPKVVCIGPVTAAEARASGLRVHATADPHRIDGLVAAVERALRGRARRARGEGANGVRPGHEEREGVRPLVSYPRHRPRRLRRTEALRSLVRETDLQPRHLVAPLFVKEGIDEPAPIASMPGQYQHTVESLRKEARSIASRGVLAFTLFGVPARKDAEGSEAGTRTASRSGDCGRSATNWATSTC